MKIAPLMKEIGKYKNIKATLVHTEQHYDYTMSKLFFEELGIPEPDIYLGVGSGSHAKQTADIMVAFERVLLQEKPDLVMVVGDVNSTIACTLVASKIVYQQSTESGHQSIANGQQSQDDSSVSTDNQKQSTVNGPQFTENSQQSIVNGQQSTNSCLHPPRPLIAHVEAGLRSFDRTMPEEINRILTDHLSDFLFITEPSAEDNLRKEGVASEKIFFVGNTMIDTLLEHRQKAEQSPILEKLGLQAGSPFPAPPHLHPEPSPYAVLTLHRPSNTDIKEEFETILSALNEIKTHILIVFPCHPRTAKQITSFHLESNFTIFDFTSEKTRAQIIHAPPYPILMMPPLGYLDFLRLMSHARFVLTDSGGIQEETTILGIPCITIRNNTERPITVSEGTNILTGTNKDTIVRAVINILTKPAKKTSKPHLWDGNASERIVKTVLNKMS